MSLAISQKEVKPMRTTLIFCLAFTVFTIAAEEPGLSPQLEKTTNDLLVQLGDDEFTKREEAAAALLKLARENPDILPLLDAALETKDQEVRTRLARIVSQFPRRGGALIRGKISLNGAVPKRKEVDTSGDRAVHQFYIGAPMLSEELIVSDGGGTANALIYISKGFEDLKYDVPTDPVVLDQIKGRFEPHVLAMMAGQALKIKNSDPLTHNVHGLSPDHNNLEFNLSQAKQGAENLQNRITVPEVCFKIQCDIHKWMKAYVGVFSHPFFVVSRADGSFEIGGLPAGQYTVTVWHEKLGTLSEEVNIGAREKKKVNFTYQPK
jgi:hypothetical protein